MSVAAGLVILMLLGASWSDLQTRRVRNAYWIPFIVCAAILWLERGFDIWLIAGAAIMTAIPYAMWWFGLFGGADAKGLMVFAWLWPGVPDLFDARTLPVLDTMVNAALIAILLPFLFLAINLLRGDVAFPAMLLGTRMDREHAAARHVWPLQRMHEGRLVWRYWQRPAEGLGPAYAALRIAGIERVWVTPKLPFMVPLAVGAAITAWRGNLIIGF